MEYVFVFFIGAIVASCINVVAYRYVRKQQFFIAYSKCPHCNKRIKLYEMIPIVSYLLQKGKCKSCKAKISIRYPITELIGGILAIGCYCKLNILYFLLLMNLLLISLIDIETMEIDNRFQFAILLHIIVIVWVNKNIDFRFSGLMITILFVLSFTNKIGGADIKLLAILSLLGFKINVIGIYSTLLISLTYCLFLIVKKKKKRKDMLPFIPLISIGYTIALFFVEEMLSVYCRFLLT